jgi:hypothetical protein
MADLLNRLRNIAVDPNTPPHLRGQIAEAALEIAKLRSLDSQAATYVESLICMRSHRFTGKPPYVGWSGLGLALSEDYDELDRLRRDGRHG